MEYLVMWCVIACLFVSFRWFILEKLKEERDTFEMKMKKS